VTAAITQNNYKMKARKNMAKEDEFEEQIKSKNQAFVLFYASWCPFSQRFLPVFNRFAENQTRECIKVVADFNESLCDKYSIEVYPTVLFFEKGKVAKRLDGEAGEGLNKAKLEVFAKKC
jgi:thiol-disulfide isomerase/thioredoxin